MQEGGWAVRIGTRSKGQASESTGRYRRQGCAETVLFSRFESLWQQRIAWGGTALVDHMLTGAPASFLWAFERPAVMECGACNNAIGRGRSPQLRPDTHFQSGTNGKTVATCTSMSIL